MKLSNVDIARDSIKAGWVALEAGDLQAAGNSFSEGVKAYWGGTGQTATVIEVEAAKAALGGVTTLAKINQAWPELGAVLLGMARRDAVLVVGFLRHHQAEIRAAVNDHTNYGRGELAELLLTGLRRVVRADGGAA